MAIKKLNEPKSKQCIEILNFFARHAAKYIYIYTDLFCVLRPPSPFLPLCCCIRFKNKKNQEQRHMLHVCICVCVCVVCVYFRVYVLCGHCVTPTSTSTSLLPSTWFMTFNIYPLFGGCLLSHLCVSMLVCVCAYLSMCVCRVFVCVCVGVC